MLHNILSDPMLKIVV